MPYANEECEVYCSICQKVIKLKKGEEIPTCCGKLMVEI